MRVRELFQIGILGAWVATLLLVAGTAEAQYASETITIPGTNFYLNPGEMRTLRLPGGVRRVEKLFIQAYGYYYDATFEVVVNGDTKGTVHVPGSDPNYVVTVGGTVTDSIQLRHIRGSSAAIIDIKAVVSRDHFPSRDAFTAISPASDLPAYNQATMLALRAIHLVDALEDFANYAEYGTYLLPIKKSAGWAYSLAAAQGDLAYDVRVALFDLKQQIRYAASYLNDTFERTAGFNLAVELASLGAKLDWVLR